MTRSILTLCFTLVSTFGLLLPRTLLTVFLLSALEGGKVLANGDDETSGRRGRDGDDQMPDEMPDEKGRDENEGLDEDYGGNYAPPALPAYPPNPSTLSGQLRVGTLWVVRSGSRTVAIRVGLEIGTQMVGSVTLDPTSGKPVALERRNSTRPTRAPSKTQMTTWLKTLRKPGLLTLGQYALPIARGVQLSVFSNKLNVARMFLDRQGKPLADAVAALERKNSTLSVR